MDHGWFSRYRVEPELDPARLPARIAALACKAAIAYATAWALAEYAIRSGLGATIYHPVTAYLHKHALGLPMNVHGVIDLWAFLGEGAFLAGALVRSSPARLTWIAWGAATTAMVWAGTARPGRTVAAGVAVLAWAAASILALRSRNGRS